MKASAFSAGLSGERVIADHGMPHAGQLKRSDQAATAWEGIRSERVECSVADAHRDLDAAVAAAYGWPADISKEDALAKLLELNLARAGTAGTEPAQLDLADEE